MSHSPLQAFVRIFTLSRRLSFIEQAIPFHPLPRYGQMGWFSNTMCYLKNSKILIEQIFTELVLCVRSLGYFRKQK